MKNSHGSMVAVIPAMLLTACVDNRNDFAGASPSAEISAANVLPAPENLSASASDNEVNLSWDAVDGATAYNVYIYNESGYAQNSYLPANSNAGGFTKVNTNSHLVSSLEYEVDYYFNVTAVADTLESSQSNEVGVRPLLNFSNSTPSMRLLDFNANAAEMVTLSAEVSDPDGNDISYLWKQTSGDSVDISDSDQAEAYFTAPIADAPVDLGFVLTINDDYGASNSKTTTVSVSDNIAPQVDAGADQSVSAGNLVNLLGSASDSDGDIAGITWQLSSGSGVILSSTSTLATSFVAPSSSSELTLVFQLSVTDDRGASASDTVTVTVGIDQEATIDSAISTSVPENTSGIVYTVSATSSEDEVLSYDFSGADIDDFTIDSDDGTIAFSNPPDYENPADSDGDNVYQLNFEVSDSVNTLKQALSIEVTDLDEFDVTAPEDDDAAANEIAENSTTDTLVGITANASDADGTNNTISYSFAGSSLTSPDGLFDIDASTGVVSYNGSGSLDYETGATSYSLDIYARSSDGSSASTSFTVKITDVNEAPVFASTSDSISAVENSTEVFYIASASDEDADAIVTYSLASGGADNDLFNLNTASGELQFKAAPDYETFLDSDSDGIYQVIISASDGSLSSENDLELAVSVSNVNEAPTITSATSASTPENTESTTTIYTASATDPENDTLTYALSGTDADDFNIDPNSGTISFANTPDHETPTDADTDNVYQVTLEASDGNGNSASQELTISVTNVNEIPLITSSANASVPENTTTTIYTASATDPEDDTLTYALSGTDTDDFIIDPSSGAISFVDTPNYEIPTDDNSNNVYQVTLEVSDDNDNNTSLVLTIKVTNVNEAPTFTSATSASVPENTTTTIYTASATDPENDTLTYALSGTDKDEFIIDSSSGALTFANTPDYEAPTDADTNNVYQVTLEVSDGNGNNASQELTISVTDGNETPTIISETSASITENTSIATTIYTASATDPENDTLTYSLSGTDQDNFIIDPSNGAISFVNNPNYEAPTDADTNNVYQVTLEVSDGSNTVTQELTFTVTDSNEFSVSTPTDADGTPNQISEDAVAGTAVGITASASDADGTNNTVSYGFTNDNLITTAESLFSVASDTGIVTLTHSNVLDYESETSYKLVIEATSSDGSSATSTFTIDLTDVNEHHVSFSMLSPDADSSPNQISEDAAAGTAVGITASASDYDGTNNTINYSFDNDSQTSADNLFSIASDTGIVTLASGASLDYETATSHDIVIKATSSDGSSTTHTFTVSVTDVNDNDPIITASQSFSVDENSADGASIGTVAATDADLTATTYQDWTIAGGNTNNAFAINSSTGEITVANSSELDYESGATSYTLSLTVSDGTNTSSAETVTINVKDLNDNAPVITSSQLFSVDENSANGASVGTATATDADVTATTYQDWTIAGGNTNNAFAIDPSTGEITVATSSQLDTETTPSYTLSLTVSDGANTSSAETVTININDLNDNTPIINPSQSFSVDENSANATSVGTVVATDADVTATTYQDWTITGGNTNNAFAINPSTGEITVATSSELDRENTASYSLTITVSDGANTSSAETVTVNVNDLNDNLPIITASQSFSVDENSASLTSVGTVVATDADATATTYQDWTITGGNTGNAFAINPSTGEITVATSSELDYESGAILYTLSLTVSDGTNTSAATEVTINVNDLNDNTPIITASQSFSIDENSANATSVGTVAATDADATATTYEDWTITGGNTNNAFVINDSTGELSVADASQLDYESGAILYTLSLTVSDGANTSSAETVTISVNDLNDNLPIIAASQSFSVDENSANGTSLGAVAATDADATATTYQNWTITGGNTNSAFAIDPDTGELTVNTSSELDTETTPSYSLSITVSDGANTATAETVTININDLNDNTPIITPSQSFDIDEASANGTSLGTVAATDADATATTYQDWSITAGNTNNAFAINPSTGELTVNTSSELDYESGTILYTLSLTVSDGATTSAAEAITINILDVSEHDAAPSAAYLGLPDNYINITFTPESGVSYQLHRSFVEGCTSSSCDAEGYKLFASPNSSGTADTMTFSQTHYYSLVGDNSTTFTTSINDSDGAKLSALVAAQSLSTEYDLTNDWVNISATDSNNVTYTLYMAGEPFAAGGCEDSELDNIGSLCADGSSLSDGSMHSATEVINWSARRYYRLDISDGYQVVHSLESNASVIDPVLLNASNASLTIDITWSALNSSKLAEYTVYLSDDSAATTASAATWSSLSNPQIISGNSSELYSLVPILSQYYVAITATNTENETTPLSKVYLVNNIVTGDPDPSTWHEIIADTDDSPAHWEGRSTHGSLVFQDKMWLIGGRTANEAHIAEVWSSTDGYNWTEVNPSAAFGARREFVSMVHDGKMWVLGGDAADVSGGLTNDVWYSSDGDSWHEATEAASWHARDYFGGVAFASGATGSDEMWVLGHYTGDPRGIPGVEDHHYSTDGSTWSSVSVSGLPPSSFFPAITFNNAILIVGGYFYTNSAWSDSNTIYSSTDGVNWTELSVNGSIWDARRVHTTLVYDDKLWVLAGYSGYNRDDYWYSSDGTQWHEVTASGSKWEARSVHTSVNHAGRMWMLGGYGSTGDRQLNDVWASGLEITSFSFNLATTN